MSNLTSTLTLQLKDDGLAAKAKADAEALKKLGASGADLKKLGEAGAAALKQLDALAGKGARLDAFKAGSRALKDQGNALRQARATVAKESAALSRAQAAGDARAIKAAEKAHTAAMRRQAAQQEAFIERGKAVRDARNQLLQSGVGRAGRGLALGAAEKQLAAETEAANAQLREQIALLGRVAGAEHKAAAAAKTHAMAERMATADSRRQAIAQAERRLRDGMGRSGGMGAAAAAGAEAGAVAHASRRRRGGGHSEEDQRDHYIRHHGIVGYTAAGAAGYASAHGVVGGIEKAVHAGASYQHELVALKNAGRTDHELEEIHAASKATSAAVPTASYEENLKVVNETTSAFGSLHHAIEHLTFMQKAASVVHAAAGDKVQDDAGEMGNKMARFAEERGTAGNGEVFERESEKLVRAMVFTRGNFNPSEMLNFAQQAKSSLQGYNERFLTGIMPSIVGTMGGDRAGTAANSFNGVIDGKVNDMKQAEEWMRLGLLDKSQAIMKKGHAVGWRTGAIKDTALAHADPLEWMETVVLPALREKGGRDGKGINVDDKEQLKQALATMFRNQTANFFANELSQLNMRTRLHKDEALMTQVGSMDDIYKRNLASDPKVALTGLKAALENLMTTATGPGMPFAAKNITGLSTAIQAISNAASDHPAVAMAAGGAAAAAGLAGAGALSYGIMNGFGLGASAVALDGAAAALTSAAVAQGGTAAGGAAAAAAAGAAGGAKAGRWARAGKFVKGAAGVAGVGVLAELAQQQNVLTAPDASDGLGRAVVAAFDPVLADLIYGESSSVGRGRRANAAGRRMAGIRGSSLPTEIGSARLGFGLNGPVGALDAVPLGSGGGGPSSGFGASPVDAGKIAEAKLALEGYRAELASLKTDMAATAGLDLPGLGEGMERRKTELEGLISGMEAKLQSLGAVTVAPQVDTSGLQSLKSSADAAAAALQRVISLAGGANVAIASVNANGGMLRGRSSGNAFHDGETPGYGAE
ncbi:cell envelope integrity protein TolA [Methylobacterium sp. 391_Methyba4]|uniref:cell envelope integrity protein TolA n=1 Tax=Methylobacterium sp. 391_Methyba4 TaxID=3038924 RepID=UPI00241EDCD7|nr:cell envelope integrity protein TolA [Methylobacterium sp. 391_Methyba4]WFS07620.1 cell envelope integrity protein TolA [Methylobacterium sp. 391_Methyba4]